MDWNNTLILRWNVFKSRSLEIYFDIILSKNEIIFANTVLLISLRVIIFTSRYISSDNIRYFIMIVIIFILSMLLLIYLPNIIILIIGWDGLGLTSYLLVIYYNRNQSLASGIITAISNRVGDALIIIALSLCYININFLNLAAITFITPILLFILASFTKRAQIPFSAWLPAAIAAPTPVSALVHSSTLVTAGVFLICRFYKTISQLSIFHRTTFYLGVITCLIASLAAVFENDLKKIIALSTLRQLGVIVFTIGIKMPELAFYHLITHAFFKALIFIAAGTIIHRTITQDIRIMGNIWNTIPITSTIILVSNFSLCGFPYIAGFYSKDMIVESIISSSFPLTMFALCLLSIFLTGLYSSRVLFYLLIQSPNYYYNISSDETLITYLSYMILGIGAIVRGYYINIWINPPVTASLPFLIKIMVLGTIILLFILIQKYRQPRLYYFFIHMFNLQLISPNFSKPWFKFSQAIVNIERTWLIWSYQHIFAGPRKLFVNTKISMQHLVILLLLLLFFIYMIGKIHHLTALACPKNITSFWSFGSLLGLCLVTQILTGVFLAIYYVADTKTAFDSVVYISRDVWNGWLVRNIHANGASLFFICFYLHIGRGLYFSSYKIWKPWVTGVTLFLLGIVTAFMGYVLPWGQMSYWAATVITNLLSRIPYVGNIIVTWLWGGFSVDKATLTRFYAFHFVFPFIMAALSIIHLFFLHEKGSSNPVGLSLDYVKFHPYFTYKDLVGFILLWSLIRIIVFFFPNTFTDPENFIKANPLVTPTHIQPEWYFLPIYAILRRIPNKLGGVIALLMSVGILYVLPLTSRTSKPFWWFCSIFLLLMWIGGKPVEYPFESIGQLATLFYFIIVWEYKLRRLLDF